MEDKTLSQALPELEEIAKELGVKVNNGIVLEEYFKRHPKIVNNERLSEEHISGS